VRAPEAAPDEVARLGRFLDDALGSSAPVPITATPMAGGGSCEAFAVDRGGDQLVLRRAPRHASSATAHDVAREFRILDAIKDQPVPLARPRVACADPAVFGAPFFVMDRVHGSPVLRTIPAAWTQAPETQGRALDQLIDALVAVHAVDWVACGLGDLAHEGPYLPRQLTRWLDQLGSYGGRDLPAAHAVGTWLDANRPADCHIGIIHGDYQFANVMFARDAPKLAAIVDWELSTLGDPLLDLAWLLAAWSEPGDPPGKPMQFGPWDGMPSRAELVARYAEVSGRDTSAMPWFLVLACYKLGIVLEGTHARACAGQAPKEIGDALHAYTVWLFAKANQLL
jgi:aminoglycoside phosphotransferase (APT) family kinase protein